MELISLELIDGRSEASEAETRLSLIHLMSVFLLQNFRRTRSPTLRRLSEVRWRRNGCRCWVGLRKAKKEKKKKKKKKKGKVRTKEKVGWKGFIFRAWWRLKRSEKNEVEESELIEELKSKKSL